VLTHYVTDGLEKTVADNYERALRALTKAGVKLTDINCPSSPSYLTSIAREVYRCGELCSSPSPARK